MFPINISILGMDSTRLFIALLLSHFSHLIYH